MALATRSKPPAHYKKRQASHHRKGKHYLKAYLPYLPMLLIVGIGLTINSLWHSPAKVMGASSDFTNDSLLSATNQNRSEASLLPLSLDPALSSAAQAKASDMVKHDYWAHNSPEGSTPWTFIATSGYEYRTAGENLAYGFNDAYSVTAGWMNSSEHRANILSHDYQNVGFGVAQSPNYQGQGPETIVVAEYGQPITSAAHITFTVPQTSANTPVKDDRGAKTEISARPVSRIQVLTGGNAAWTTLVVGAIAGAALALFITRHSLRLHRALAHGENFVMHHPKLDVLITFVFTAGFVLTRTSGIIR